jgi:hypothetical protein
VKLPRSKIIATLSVGVLVVALLATAEVASAKKKQHPATPIPTGSNAHFTLDSMTFYGFFDNSPPGTAIAHPVIHSGAAGVGTFEDPITFANGKCIQ